MNYVGLGLSSLRLFFLLDGVRSVDGSERQLPVIDAHYHQPILLPSSKKNKRRENKTTTTQQDNKTPRQQQGQSGQRKKQKNIEKMGQSKLV